MRSKNVRLRRSDSARRTLPHSGPPSSFTAAAIRLVAKRSVRKKKGPAPAGQPPHTHTKRLPRAIKYAVEKQRGRVVIGPDVESFGTAGKAHEHGGTYKHERYARRPFMGPALEKTKERLPRMWAGTVK
jgi:hypothetical protein